jgi:hypothetical protein
MVRARAASTVTVIGLTCANAWTAPGIDAIGTNADETKVLLPRARVQPARRLLDQHTGGRPVRLAPRSSRRRMPPE